MKGKKKNTIIIIALISSNILLSTNANNPENKLIYSKHNHALITQFAINYLNKKHGPNFITKNEAKPLTGLIFGKTIIMVGLGNMEN